MIVIEAASSQIVILLVIVIVRIEMPWVTEIERRVGQGVIGIEICWWGMHFGLVHGGGKLIFFARGGY